MLARGLRAVDPDREPKPVVDAAHPLGVAPSQVVVDRDHVHALAGQGVEIDRQRRGQGFTLTGAHFGDLSAVQRHAAYQLHVEVAHFEHALAGLAHGGKGLGQQRIQRLALRQPLFEFGRLGLHLGIAQALELGLEGVDAGHRLAVGFEQALVAVAKELGQELKRHGKKLVSRPAAQAVQ